MENFYWEIFMKTKTAMSELELLGSVLSKGKFDIRAFGSLEVM